MGREPMRAGASWEKSLAEVLSNCPPLLFIISHLTLPPEINLTSTYWDKLTTKE
jgi:hypothetical protein